MSKRWQVQIMSSKITQFCFYWHDFKEIAIESFTSSLFTFNIAPCALAIYRQLSAHIVKENCIMLFE